MLRWVVSRARGDSDGQQGKREGGDVLSLPRAGGTPTLVVKGGDSVYAFQIAIDKDYLYWRNNGASLNASGAERMSSYQLASPLRRSK